MKDVRGLFNSITPAGILIPVALSALLIWNSFSGMTGEVDRARCMVDDLEQALVVFESGKTDFQGRCLGMSIGEGAPVDFSWVRDELESARASHQAAVERLVEDPWRRAANSVGGVALAFFALFFGGMTGGSPLGAAVTAWGLSNGWTRSAWVRSALTLSTLATVVLYTLGLLLAVFIIYSKITGAGIDIGFPAPSVAALHPIPGLLYFTMLGVLIGLVIGRGEIAGMTAVVLAIADFIGSARFGLAPYFPTSWHQIALGSADGVQGKDLISRPTALSLALATAVALAAVSYWFLTRRRDVPDR